MWGHTCASSGCAFDATNLFLWGLLPLNGARLVEVETGTIAHANHMPPNRLVTLLQQAVAFQIGSGRFHPEASAVN